jgi:hypothetical protein
MQRVHKCNLAEQLQGMASGPYFMVQPISGREVAFGHAVFEGSQVATACESRSPGLR